RRAGGRGLSPARSGDWGLRAPGGPGLRVRGASGRAAAHRGVAHARLAVRAGDPAAGHSPGRRRGGLPLLEGRCGNPHGGTHGFLGKKRAAGGGFSVDHSPARRYTVSSYISRGEARNMEKVRLGIIGAGNMGSGHIGNYKKGLLPEIEITAVAD